MTHLPIQIVDENDRPINQTSIIEAHEKGLIHRVVRIMVEDGKGNILLQKRSKHMLRWPNCWDNSAAGHVDAGEDYLTAAKRELFEEIGIQTDKLEEIGAYFTDAMYKDSILKRFNKVYKIIVEETPKNLQKEEVSEVEWFSLDDVRKLIKDKPDQVTDGLQDVISRYY